MTHRKLAERVVETGDKLQGTRYYKPFEKKVGSVVSFYKKRANDGSMVTHPVTAPNGGLVIPRTVVTRVTRAPNLSNEFPRVIAFDLNGTLDKAHGPVSVNYLVQLKRFGKKVYVTSGSKSGNDSVRQELIPALERLGIPFVPQDPKSLKAHGVELYIGDKASDEEIAGKSAAKFVRANEFSMSKLVNG